MSHCDSSLPNTVQLLSPIAETHPDGDGDGDVAMVMVDGGWWMVDGGWWMVMVMAMVMVMVMVAVYIEPMVLAMGWHKVKMGPAMAMVMVMVTMNLLNDDLTDIFVMRSISKYFQDCFRMRRRYRPVKCETENQIHDEKGQ